MAQAELGNECVDGSDLNPAPPACVSQLCRSNVIFPSWLDQRQRGKPLDDLRTGLGA